MGQREALGIVAPGVVEGSWERGSDDDNVRFSQDFPATAVERVSRHDGRPFEGTAGGRSEGRSEGHEESDTDDSGDMSAQGVAALLQVIAGEDKKAGEQNEFSRRIGPTDGDDGRGHGRGHAGDGSDSSQGTRPSFDSNSSSNFEFSPAHPVYTAGDLWGSSGGRTGAYYNPEGGSHEDGVSEQVMDTPHREAAVRLEATVAATVAQVAAETYDPGSTPHGFLNTGRNGTGKILGSGSSCVDDDDDDDGSGHDPLGSLPIAGSRSPREGTAPAAGFGKSGRLEPDSESDLSYQKPKSSPRRSSGAGSSSDGFAGGLPLAGSRSPPAVRVPGRREPDSSDVNSSDVRALAAVAAVTGVAVASNKSPRRGERRRQRRRQKEGEQWREYSLPTTAGAHTAFPADAPSVLTSAPLNLSSPQMLGSHSAGGGGGGAEGRRQRDAEYRAEGRLLRSGNRSDNHWWNRESSNTGDESSGDGGGGDRGGLDTGGQRPRGQQAGRLLGTTRRHARNKQPNVVAAARNNHASNRSRVANKKKQRPSVVWRQVAGGRWAGGTTTVAAGEATATTTARAKAVVMEEAGLGLRATHFAPGYIGVAWPNPQKAGGVGGHMAVARDKLLAKLEQASARKIAEVEERSLRARRERAERLKRRYDEKIESEKCLPMLVQAAGVLGG